ncbi:ABC transporter substrate-binding protein [Bradyrhizobium liaoningense]|uniref:ABC transporter substrate-binding protein n=1 Tax=Bradyrhizobium liaoningense TaxID=43992 RepID=UPI001BAC071F|nr:ABC transporter substrate-binding protein [Bradyrhizobium liaoningense]MBR0716941.1 ABC transporter substrate-binding protein [Bradyrhizobium liaoningense]
MRRREFTIAFAAIAAWPITSHAQQAKKLPVIGFLGAATPAVANSWVAAFTKRLAELGWIDGRSIIIEYRWAESRPERYSQIAEEFVAAKVDVIVTWASAPVLAAKQATTVVPVVFAAQMDPVGVGVVASLARPGGNVTGLSIQQTDTAAKRLELMREIAPHLRRLATMVDVTAPGAILEIREVQATARTLGWDVVPVEISQAEDIAPAIEGLANRADALYVATGPLVLTHRVRINALAMSARLPTIYGYREYVAAGGLLSYGPNYPDLFRRAADYVDKILRGAKPADLPVEQPTKFDLVVNLQTARALGLTVPSTLLVRADEVIE